MERGFDHPEADSAFRAFSVSSYRELDFRER